jgi:hypothetical protein
LILGGSSLALLRPSVMTWAFFVLCIATGPGCALGKRDLPAWLVLANGTFAETLRALALGAFLAFCVSTAELQRLKINRKRMAARYAGKSSRTQNQTL